MKRFLTVLLASGCLLAAGLGIWQQVPAPLPDTWSPVEIALIRSLSLNQLPPLPADPSNAYGDHEQAAELGQRLYFDTRLSGNGTISCASCHRPELMFTDGLPLAVGAGTGTRHTPSLVGIAYSPWFYWDGRKDSQWSQALAPFEAPHEHDIDRLSIARLVTGEQPYKEMYEAIFGTAPILPTEGIASPLGREAFIAGWNRLNDDQRTAINRVFANVGKAIAAYQRKLQPGLTRFDHYADAITEGDSRTGNGQLDATELAGLDLFLNKGQCVNCHNGPLFTNNDFHNTGVMVIAGQLPPMGRYDGVRIARLDPFNCLGDYSDAQSGECTELEFARDTNELVGAHKTPTLRNVSWTAPYMHGGQIASLEDVIRHYDEAPVSMLSHNEAKPLALRSVERRQLEAFLRTLSAPLATPAKWLTPP